MKNVLGDVVDRVDLFQGADTYTCWALGTWAGL